ncbi:MAG TPA: hypothetical protein VJ719_05895 [Chthoniobacterales bacterium]|nr:hypothetical protein [Chthoniobacterales bacterium]
MNRDQRFVLVGFAVWLGLALALGLTGRFEQASAQAVGATVWILTILLLLGWWKIPVINRWADSVDLRWLIALHLMRFVGLYFLFLCRRDELSCRFAHPAGIGDAITAIGAAILLLWPMLRGRKPAKPPIDIWNVFGFLDIIVVVITAYRVGLSDWIGMAALRALPLMLLPTFLVPLIIVSHILIFVRLRTGRLTL